MNTCPECGTILKDNSRRCFCGWGGKTSEAPRNYNCAARGCPLPGSLTSTAFAGPSTEWFCRHHYQAEPYDWPRITAEVIASQPRIQGARLPAKDSDEWNRLMAIGIQFINTPNKSMMAHKDPKAGWRWIREQYMAGKDVCISSIENASAVLGEVWKNRECVPR